MDVTAIMDVERVQVPTVHGWLDAQLRTVTCDATERCPEVDMDDRDGWYQEQFAV